LWGGRVSPSETRAIYAARAVSKDVRAGCGPTGQLLIDNATNSLSAGPGWASETIDFTATNSTTAVELIGGGPSSVRVDQFELLTKADAPGLYYLPEEPLTPLFGENAYGEWKLEVWDTRAGAALTNMSLLSWELKFVFVNTNLPATLLTNGQCYS